MRRRFAIAACGAVLAAAAPAARAQQTVEARGGLSVSRELRGFSVGYDATDISKGECAGNNICSARALASVSRKF